MKKQNKDVHLQVPVTEEVAARIRAIAEDEGESMAQIIRRAIKMLIKAKEAGNG